MDNNTSERLVVDRGFLRVQFSSNEDPFYRLAVAERLTDGTIGNDTLFLPFQHFVAIQKKIIQSPNGSIRKGKLTIDLDSPVSCGTFSTIQVVLKMDEEDAYVLYTNIFRL